MLKKLLTTFLFGLLLSFTVYAQNGTIKGTVTDARTGEPLIGTTVQLVELSKGTPSGMDGTYEITSVPAGTYTLRVSFVGYQTFEQSVEIGSGTVILDVALAEDVSNIGEFVVTALGQKTNERAVTFSTQTVDAEKLNVTQDINIKTGLAGKVAGVQIAGQAGSKLGDFGDIRIRGAISLTNALSEPLFVVDGVPVQDPNSIDMGNVADINVLKGPNATALYGQRGESGVVLISTKTADRSGVSVELTNTLTFDKVAYLPNYQNEYGQGYDGQAEWQTFNYTPGTDPSYFQALDGVSYIANSNADESWGPKLDGRQYAPWYTWFPDSPYYGKTQEYKAHPDNIKNFYDTGMSNKAGVAVNVFGNKYSGRLSYSNLSQNGIMPYSNLDKHFLTGNFDFDVTDDFNVTARVNYTTQKVHGDVYDDGYGNQTSGSFNSWFGRDLEVTKMRELKNLTTPEGYMTTWNWWGPDYYFSGNYNNGFKKPAFWYNSFTWMDRYDIDRTNDNLLLDFNASYQLTNELEISGSANTTKANYNREFYLPYSIQYSSAPELYNPWVNSFGVYKTEQNEDNFEGRINYKSNFGDINVDAFAGGNMRLQNYNRFSADMSMSNYQSGGLLIPDVYSFSNSAETITPVATNWEKKVYSLYAKASVGYQDFIYLDASYRQDWSSALPENNNGYGYPSIGASFVFSELIDNDVLSYGKLRAGWAQVGNDVGAEAIMGAYALSSNPYSNPITGNSVPLLFTDATVIDPNIKPALNSSFEAGFDLRFINDRIGFNATYYTETRKDEIIDVSLSNTNGASRYLTNAGKTERDGIELTLQGSPVQTRDFLWDVTVNWAQNTTTVKELPQGLDTYDLVTSQAFDFVYVTHKVGEEWGQLRGAAIERDANGNAIINPNGTYAVEQNHFFGSVLPDFTGGILNTFAYKNFNLAASIDFQKGGKFFSLTEQWGISGGLLEETAGTNDRGNPKRDAPANGGGVHVTGVDASGNAVDKYVDAHTYSAQWYSNRLAEPFIHDASYIKLRELSLSYNLPDRIIGGFLNSATIGVVARNVWLIAVSDDNTHGWDPSEMSQVYGENAQLPGTRSFGFNVKLTF
jgi:TonB-linked SusC/RagA family outer membrane protein